MALGSYRGSGTSLPCLTGHINLSGPLKIQTLSHCPVLKVMFHLTKGQGRLRQKMDGNETLPVFWLSHIKCVQTRTSYGH